MNVRQPSMAEITDKMCMLCFITDFYTALTTQNSIEVPFLILEDNLFNDNQQPKFDKNFNINQQNYSYSTNKYQQQAGNTTKFLNYNIKNPQNPIINQQNKNQLNIHISQDNNENEAEMTTNKPFTFKFLKIKTNMEDFDNEKSMKTSINQKQSKNTENLKQSRNS